MTAAVAVISLNPLSKFGFCIDLIVLDAVDKFEAGIIAQALTAAAWLRKQRIVTLMRGS